MTQEMNNTDHNGSPDSITPYEFYKETRDQIKHEDNLVDCRLKWALQANGFLFTAFAVPYSSGDAGDGRAATFRLILCLLGIVISLYIFRKIKEANNSLDKLEKDWHIFLIKRNLRPEEYPQISGSITVTSQNWSDKRPDNLLPLAFIIAWIIMFFLINT